MPGMERFPVYSGGTDLVTGSTKFPFISGPRAILLSWGDWPKAIFVVEAPWNSSPHLVFKSKKGPLFNLSLQPVQYCIRMRML